MVKCLSCGWAGFNEDVIHDRVYAGEYQGQSAYEALRLCPECKDDELTSIEGWFEDEQSYS